MTTVVKSVPPGTVSVAQADKLRNELASKYELIGSKCLDVTVDGGDVNDSLIMEFDLAPNDAALDAAIAAYPSVLDGVTGTFVVTAGSTYILKEEPLREGESLVFDVHVHVAMGVAADFNATFADWYVIANRAVGGSVEISRGSGVTEGSIPGCRVVATKTNTTARISITVQRDGTMTVLSNDISIESRGAIPT